MFPLTRNLFSISAENGFSMKKICVSTSDEYISTTGENRILQAKNYALPLA